MKHFRYLMLGMLMIFLCSIKVFAQDASEILKQVDARLTPESFEAYRKLINEEPDGKKKEFIFYTIKKGADKVAMVMGVARATQQG